jgi:hypothetical protein
MKVKGPCIGSSSGDKGERSFLHLILVPFCTGFVHLCPEEKRKRKGDMNILMT